MERAKLTYRDIERAITQFVERQSCAGAPDRTRGKDSTVYSLKTRSSKRVVESVDFYEVERNKLVLEGIINNYCIYRYFYCSCSDFYMRNIARNGRTPCKHLLALAALDSMRRIGKCDPP